MKALVFLFILSLSSRAFSAPVLISYFEPFGGKNLNNSEVFAKNLKNSPMLKHLDIKLCKLRTVFDKGFDELDDCLRSMPIAPSMIISLGEFGCRKIKIETRGTNLDNNYTPDNAGVIRSNTPIDPDLEMYLGATLPLEKAYCSLSRVEQRSLKISSSAGTFVCNNTLFKALANFDIPYTFIHVPASHCLRHGRVKFLSRHLASYISNLSDKSGMNSLQPKNLQEVNAILNSDISDCEQNFYKQLKKSY